MSVKKWFKSLTIWASGVVIFLQGLPEIMASLNAAIPSIDLMANPILTKAMSIAAALVAIYGRLRAKTEIK